MTIDTISAGTVPAPSAAALVALTKYETRLFARNPVFLVAFGLTAYALWDGLRGTMIDLNTVTVYPAIFLGGLGMVTAFWLTQSLRRSAEALDVAPTTPQVRTGAICLAAIVPFACGWLSLITIVVSQRLQSDRTYGVLSTSDRAALLIGQVVIPALGGPLLGVALARWVRFPPAARRIHTFPTTAPHPEGLPSDACWSLIGCACIAAITASVAGHRLPKRRMHLPPQLRVCFLKSGSIGCP